MPRARAGRAWRGHGEGVGISSSAAAGHVQQRTGPERVQQRVQQRTDPERARQQCGIESSSSSKRRIKKRPSAAHAMQPATHQWPVASHHPPIDRSFARRLLLFRLLARSLARLLIVDGRLPPSFLHTTRSLARERLTRPPPQSNIPSEYRTIAPIPISLELPLTRPTPALTRRPSPPPPPPPPLLKISCDIEMLPARL